MRVVQLLLYMPVIHKGYDELLGKYGHGEVLLIGQSFRDEYPVVRKEIRALDPQRVVEYVTATGLAPNTRVLEIGELPEAISADFLVVPDETLTRDIVERFRLPQRVREVHFERTFLRWDRESILAKHEPRRGLRVMVTDLERELGARTKELSGHSSDWWRQVGALVARDGDVIASAYNTHYPSEYAPYIDGDPRNSFRRGLNIELSTALHAEAAIIAGAAKDGISLSGTDLYVSTFPCPGCARLVTAAGVARCFYAGGYSMLDGERIFDEGGVQVIFVDLNLTAREQTAFADVEGPHL